MNHQMPFITRSIRKQNQSTIQHGFRIGHKSKEAPVYTGHSTVLFGSALNSAKVCKCASRYVARATLQLVEEVVERWDALLETLAFPGIGDNSSWLR